MIRICRFCANEGAGVFSDWLFCFLFVVLHPASYLVICSAGRNTGEIHVGSHKNFPHVPFTWRRYHGYISVFGCLLLREAWERPETQNKTSRWESACLVACTRITMPPRIYRGDFTWFVEAVSPAIPTWPLQFHLKKVCCYKPMIYRGDSPIAPADPICKGGSWFVGATIFQKSRIQAKKWIFLLARPLYHCTLYSFLFIIDFGPPHIIFSRV
jgi:hypothetical protein